MSRRHEVEAAAILGSHGVADGLTTALAAVVIGSSAEVNPIVGSLLDAGVGWAVGSMLLVVGLVAVAWPSVADEIDPPHWFAPALVAVGLIVAIANLAAVVAVGWSA